jgi:hypothetical protein
MRHQVSKELFAYWNKLRGARAAPDRAHIDPAMIRNILADAFILEVDAEGAFPFRFSGARIDALWQAEQRGESFVDLWQEKHRRSVSATLMTAMDGVTPVIAGARTSVAAAEHQLELELLLLPLRHFGKTHARMLGALSPAHPAEWLGEMRVDPLEFLSMRVLFPGFLPGAVQAVQHGQTRPRLVVYNQIR